jgi:Fe-S-cluster containining protein
MNEQSQETVSVNFAVGIGDGKFTATAVVPAGQTNLTAILPVIQSLDDSFISGVTAQLSEAGFHVSCKAGCGACCRQMVPISIFEAEALSDWIRSLPEVRQQELAGRFHQTLLALAKAGLIDRIVSQNWFDATESARKLALDYFYQNLPCPFLEEESCSIHPIRPLICREYLVTSSPKFCEDPAGMQVVPARLPLNFSRILNSIGAELERDSRGWIPLVFLFAWMESGARPGASVAGVGPQVLYEFVKRMDCARSPLSEADATETANVERKEPQG